MTPRSVNRTSGITRVGVTPGAANDGFTPIFSVKNWQPFLVITVCQFCSVTPIFSSRNWRPFLLTTVTFSDFTWVSPPGGCHPGPFYLYNLVLPTVLCKFSHRIFFIRVSPHWRVSPAAVHSLAVIVVVCIRSHNCSARQRHHRLQSVV